MRWTMMIVLVVWCAMAMAQTDRAYIRQGNKHFRHQDYDKAEVSYHKALNNNNRNPQALYNYGCTMMFEDQDSAAIAYLTKAATIESNPRRKALAYHNLGVIHQVQQDYAAAIEAYKESLRNNPADDETRYNLALCQKLLKDSDGGGGGGDNDQQNQQNQQNQQDQQDQQEQQNQQDNNSQNPPPQEQEMSQENAEQLLQDAMRKEQDLQDKMLQQQQQPSRRLQKNW